MTTMAVMSTRYDADVARAAALLADETDHDAALTAVGVARDCVALDATRVDAYVILCRALDRTRHYEEAVRWCKRGLERHAGHTELEAVLRHARLAVLDSMLDEEEADDEDASSEAHGVPDTFEPAFGQTSSRADSASINLSSATSASEALAFEAKVEKLLLHLDLQRLTRIGLWYTVQELLRLPTITGGIAALFFGLLVQAIVHRHKFMVASMLFVGLAHSQLRAKAERAIHAWVHQSTDKLGAVSWLPRVLLALPIALKTFGHLKFMLFLRRDMGLTLVVTSVTAAVVGASLKTGNERIKAWGYGKRLKFTAYATAATYWALWRGNYADTLRLLGPALLDAGGILLSSSTSREIQDSCRRAWKRVYDEVTADIQQHVDFDAWFFLGLSKWVIDYWQQPTNFSLEMLAKWLSDGFSSFEKGAVHLFRPELQRLSKEMRRIGRDAEFALLVAYLKDSLERVPPRKWLGFAGLVAKRCTSFVVALLLIVFYGVVTLPLIPFLISEAADAHALYELCNSEEMAPMDGLDVLLLGSPLVRVWENVKAAVYCLEGGMVLSRAMATSAQIVTAAARVSQLARFAAKVKSSGLADHADEIPDQITTAFVILSDYNAISEGVKHLYESSHLQDVSDAVKRWWGGGR